MLRNEVGLVVGYIWKALLQSSRDRAVVLAASA
jgi:hypothetical protein